WKHCCLEHDLYFWLGGSEKDRHESDLRLRDCVAATGQVRRSKLMYAAIRIGGASPIKFKSKKWGHGWVQQLGYLPLSPEETEHGLKELKKLNQYSSEIIESISIQLQSRLEDL